MVLPNKRVQSAEFSEIEIKRLRIAMSSARRLLDSARGAWTNDWSGHNIAEAFKVLTDALKRP